MKENPKSIFRCCTLKTIVSKSKITEHPRKKAVAFLPICAIALCVVLFALFAKPIIENHTWQLSSAQQAEPFFVIAHDPEYDFADNDSSLYALSKPIDLTCVAKNGKLTLTDKTNGKSYSGTYKVKSWRRNQRYEIVIEGKKGVANISNNSLFNRMLFMSIDGYYLNFTG